MDVIQVSGLTKQFGDIIAVANISFDVRKGEIFGFLGPNGAGKTTTIRMLMQLLTATSGKIRLLGRLQDRRQFRQREHIGYLPGNFQAYNQMTAINFLKYFSKYRQAKPILRTQLIDRFQLSPADQKKRIKYLSHGTRQKIGLIMALEHEPDLVILDEPTTGLDPLMQEVFYQVILELQQKGKTIFLSSHILTEVEKVCQRVAIIRDGEVITVESLKNLKKKQRRRLIIEYENNDSDNPPSIAGTDLLRSAGRQAEYLLKGPVGPVLKELARLPIEDMFFPEPQLEDIFLEYYQGSKE